MKNKKQQQTTGLACKHHNSEHDLDAIEGTNWFSYVDPQTGKPSVAESYIYGAYYRGTVCPCHWELELKHSNIQVCFPGATVRDVLDFLANQYDPEELDRDDENMDEDNGDDDEEEEAEPSDIDDKEISHGSES